MTGIGTMTTTESPAGSKQYTLTPDDPTIKGTYYISVRATVVLEGIDMGTNYR